jgi:membrane protein required for colicin V production
VSVPYLDIVFLVLFAIITIRVVVRGFVKEFLDMSAIIFASAGAIFLSGPLSVLLDKLFGKTGWNQIIAFLVLFLVIYLVIKIFEGALHDLFEKLNLENLDRSLGLVLGLVEGFIVISALLLLLNWLKGIKLLQIQALLDHSFIAKFLLPILIPFAHSFGATWLREKVNELIRYV